jgi:hypothetical protein
MPAPEPDPNWAEEANDLDKAAAELEAKRKKLEDARTKQARREEGIRAQGIQEGRKRQKEEDERLIENLRDAHQTERDAQADRIRHDMLNLTVPAARAHGFWRGTAAGMLFGAALAFSAAYAMGRQMVSDVFGRANPTAEQGLVWDRNNAGETNEP